MTVAFLAPGQGSRDIVAIIEFVRKKQKAVQWLEHAALVLDLPISRWLDQGARRLETTEVLQPVLTAISLAVAHELAECGINPHYVTGHSLGEIAAWAISGCISFVEAINLAALRGRLMAREAKKHPGGLLALIENPDVESALRIGRSAGWVELGAENAPDEIVLSGDDAALRAIAAVCPARRLSVAGPWHSSAMNEAMVDFREAIAKINSKPARAKLVLNHDGAVVESENDIGDHLAQQLTRPVRWSKTLETLHQAGVTDYVMLGPGAILRALVRKNLNQDVRVWNTDTESSWRSLREVLRGS